MNNIDGKELKSLRLHRKMSIEWLSTISGVSVGRIRLIEAGYFASDDIVERLLTALTVEYSR